MYQNTVHALSLTRTGDALREGKDQFYKNKLRKAAESLPVASHPKPGSLLCPAPPPPDEKTIERLNTLAAQAPFCIYYKHKKRALL